MSANHHIKQSKSSHFALAAPAPQPVQPVQSSSPPPVPQRTASYHCYSLPRQALPGPENRQDIKYIKTQEPLIMALIAKETLYQIKSAS